jgi:hypothetical protein
MKRWIFIFLLGGIFFFTALAFIVSEFTFPLIRPSGLTFNQKFYDYSGITHAHSVLSTGSGTYSDIIKAAHLANCTFLIFTDLNPIHRESDVQGYHGDVLVISAAEYSYLGGHLLAYNLPESGNFTGLGQMQLFFNDLLHQKPVRSDKGFIVAAHPFLPEHGWENLHEPGLKGMEILNLEEIWRTAVNKGILSVAWSFVIFPFNRDLAYLRLFHYPEKEIAAWDEILKTHNFLGFAGNDSTANAIPFPNKPFKFPSYQQTFRLIKNHVLLRSELTGTYSTDREKILSALDKGNFYFSADLMGDPAGFIFYGKQDNLDYLPGETILLKKRGATLKVDLGRDINLGHEIILTKDGAPILRSNGRTLSYKATQAGSYRVSVRVIPTLPIPDGKTWFTWIFSNAIRLE